MLPSYHSYQVRTLMMAVEPSASRLRFMYHVQEGVCVQRQYCTEFLAELAGTHPRPCRPAPRHLPPHRTHRTAAGDLASLHRASARLGGSGRARPFALVSTWRGTR